LILSITSGKIGLQSQLLEDNKNITNIIFNSFFPTQTCLTPEGAGYGRLTMWRVIIAMTRQQDDVKTIMKQWGNNDDGKTITMMGHNNQP
jgi:hypothetical protein